MTGQNIIEVQPVAREMIGMITAVVCTNIYGSIFSLFNGVEDKLVSDTPDGKRSLLPTDI